VYTIPLELELELILAYAVGMRGIARRREVAFAYNTPGNTLFAIEYMFTL
jgi:hypothetical protein